jgi:hypothetical protein
MLTSLKTVLIVARITGACLVCIPSFAQALLICLPLSGQVRLDPDSSCKVTTLYPGPAYLGPGIPNSCFSVTFTAAVLVPFKGSSGLTAETMTMLSGGTGQTPATLNEAGVASSQNALGLPETRLFFTARSVLSLPAGRVYTADAGVAHGDDSAEQLVVTGGDGLYKGATGTLFATGKIMGQWANYNGQLCYPGKL